MKTVGGDFEMKRCMKEEGRLAVGLRRGAICYEEKQNVMVRVASSQVKRFYLLFFHQKLWRKTLSHLSWNWIPF
jgi:hypothetical protein